MREQGKQVLFGDCVGVAGLLGDSLPKHFHQRPPSHYPARTSRSRVLPSILIPLLSAAQWLNLPAEILLINSPQIGQAAITEELFGSSISHFFPRTLPWELLCTFVLPCGGVSLITINKDRPGKTRTATDASKFT